MTGQFDAAARAAADASVKRFEGYLEVSEILGDDDCECLLEISKAALAELDALRAEIEKLKAELAKYRRGQHNSAIETVGKGPLGID